MTSGLMGAGGWNASGMCTTQPILGAANWGATPSGSGAVPTPWPGSDRHAYLQHTAKWHHNDAVVAPTDGSRPQQMGQDLGEVPLSTFSGALGMQQPTGSIVVSYLSPTCTNEVGNKDMEQQVIDLNEH